MQSLQHSFSQHSLIFWIALLVVTVALAVWLVAQQGHTRRLEARLDDLLGSADSENVGRMLVEYLGTVRATARAMDTLQQEHERLARLAPSMLRHVGLVRFSPFHDTGGDQSFTLAFLDGLRNGIVVTGLHSRSDSRLYAKPVRNGDSEYALIPEEREAIAQALSGRTEQPVSG